jgi:hypothetical protein
MAAINPLTGKPWTVNTLLAALVRCNEIANDEATAHDMCSVWEDILDRIKEETGLPLEGRGREYGVTLSVSLNWQGKEPPSEDLMRTVVENLLLEHEQITYVYVNEIKA